MTVISQGPQQGAGNFQMSLWPRKRERNDSKIQVGVLGAAGMAGQQLVVLLEDHPWFELTWLGAEEAFRGKRYGDLPWLLAGKAPDRAASLRVEGVQPQCAPRLVFSTLDATVAGQVERAFAMAGHYVFSNAPNFRTDPLVPLLVADVNPQHLDLVDTQHRTRWRGALVTTPGWPTVLLAVVLVALRDFEVKRVMLTAMADAAAMADEELEMEEARIGTEVQKVLGRMEGDSIKAHPVSVSAQISTRETYSAQTELVSVEFAGRVPIEQVDEALRDFCSAPQALQLPSAPAKPIAFHREGRRLQSSLDHASARHRMTVHVERLRRCPVLDYKFTVHGSNDNLGAATTSILNAELLLARALYAPVLS
jgi:aspartate-semialdehyde dehydrogenase